MTCTMASIPKCTHNIRNIQWSQGITCLHSLFLYFPLQATSHSHFLADVFSASMYHFPSLLLSFLLLSYLASIFFVSFGFKFPLSVFVWLLALPFPFLVLSCLSSSSAIFYQLASSCWVSYPFIFLLSVTAIFLISLEKELGMIWCNVSQ